jgi:hypothetical protein
MAASNQTIMKTLVYLALAALFLSSVASANAAGFAKHHHGNHAGKHHKRHGAGHHHHA